MADVRRETCERAARAKAPIVGIPVEGDGYRVTVVLRREHLKAACECPGIRHIVYNVETNVLTFNGGRNRWALNNLATRVPKYDIARELAAWAKGAGKRAKAARAQGTRTPEAKRRRLEETMERQIARLTKERDKIWDRRPSNPCIEMGREDADGGEHAREMEANWAAEKGKRRKLGRLCARKRLHGEPAWAKFYELAAEAIGREVSEYDRHDRVCNRKGGPTRDDYLRWMPRFVGMARKPDWQREARQTAEDIARYHEARAEYLARLRELASLDSQIAGLRDELADFKGQQAEVEHGV